MKRIRLLWIGAAAVVLVVGGVLAKVVIEERKDKPAERKRAGAESELRDSAPLGAEGSLADAKSKSSRHDAKSGRKPPAHLTPVDIMKTSLEGGALEEFTAAQVEEWSVGEPEELKGEIYNTGLVVYQAETIFGFKKVRAKAYIKNGKVEKWVYAKTGMEIR